MKVLLEIADNKAEFGLEVLRNLAFVKKASPISSKKYQLMAEIKEAVDNLKLAKAGKLNLKTAKDLYHEL